MKKELFVEMTSAEMRSVEGGSPVTEALWKIAKDLWKAINSDPRYRSYQSCILKMKRRLTASLL